MDLRCCLAMMKVMSLATGMNVGTVGNSCRQHGKHAICVVQRIATVVFDADSAQMSAFTHRRLPVCLCVKSLTAVAAKYDDGLSPVQVFVCSAIAL